ncbi:MAG: F0F1 ATP synthase subunit epsilon [Clostridia bacterium]|nr:F0F1 ATP synthase subunit epsilon [Clostridia bacterium]
MNTFPLRIAAPDGMICDEPAVQLSVRGVEGSLSVLAGHVPFATVVVPCECRVYRPDGTVLSGVCGDGFLSVTKEGTQLLVTSFVWEKEAGSAEPDGAPPQKQA